MTDESLNLPRAVAEVNHCDCHPETCCCQEWRVKLDGQFFIAGTRESCKNVAAAMNTAFDLSRTPQPDKAIKDAAHVHSCSMYCDRPDCIKAQRDQMRDATPPPPGAGEDRRDADTKRLDWLGSRAFTAYQTRDPEGRMVGHSVVVNEDAKGPRRGNVGTTIRDAIDAAMQGEGNG